MSFSAKRTKKEQKESLTASNQNQTNYNTNDYNTNEQGGQTGGIAIALTSDMQPTTSSPMSRDYSYSNQQQQQKQNKKNIRSAWKKGDANESRAAHNQQSDLLLTNMNNDSTGDNHESHKKHGEFIKSIIYGGLDGVFTTFALVAGFQGAGSAFENAATMLVFGFANVVADALSMGFGDFLSEKAEMDFAISERAREEWEFDNYPEGEIDEMVAIYMEKGMTREDATSILTTMSKYKDFFIDHMMIQELEIYPVNINSDDYDPYGAMKNGVVTFCSFLIFGSIPLLSYVIFEIINLNDFLEGADKNFKFYVCIVLSIITLMTLGVVKGKLTDTNLAWATTFVTLNGVVAAAASYFLGWGLGVLLNVDE